MLTREGLQEAQYKIFGPYHRRRLSLPFASSRLRYDVTLPLMPDNLNGLAVLDYGGGDGAMATLLADRGASVAVVDSSRAALRFAQSDARLKVVQAKTDLPIKSGSFDLVTLLETIEHIDDTSEIRALAETSRVLKPDGSAIISVPSSNRAVRMKHYRHYSYGDHIKKCESVGLIPRKVVFYRRPRLNFLSRAAVYGVALTTEQKADGIVISATKTNYNILQ